MTESELLRHAATMQVLYVEDSSTMRHATEKMLRPYFSHLDTAADGVEAFELYRNFHIQNEKNYDIVITDLEMPNMDGKELSRLVLDCDPYQELIVISASDDFNELIGLMNLGIKKFIAKPIAKEQLHEVLSDVISDVYHARIRAEELADISEHNAILKEREKIYLTQLENTIQELRDAQRQKDEFFNNISHEMRTPLNAILGLTSLLKRRSKEDPKLHEMLNVIEQSSNNLHHLIESVLDIQKIQNGEFELHENAFDPLDILTKLAEDYRKKTQEKNQEFNVSIDPALSSHSLIGDTKRLSQAISTLLANAVKFTAANGHIEFQASYENGILICQIQDNGIGIAKENHTKIFGITQIDGSTTRKHEGAGLGLALAHAIITKMGGTITVHSAEGQGATFLLEIPLKSA